MKLKTHKVSGHVLAVGLPHWLYIGLMSFAAPAAYLIVGKLEMEGAVPCLVAAWLLAGFVFMIDRSLHHIQNSRIRPDAEFVLRIARSIKTRFAVQTPHDLDLEKDFGGNPIIRLIAGIPVGIWILYFNATEWHSVLAICIAIVFLMLGSLFVIPCFRQLASRPRGSADETAEDIDARFDFKTTSNANFIRCVFDVAFDERTFASLPERELSTNGSYGKFKIFTKHLTQVMRLNPELRDLWLADADAMIAWVPIGPDGVSKHAIGKNEVYFKQTEFWLEHHELVRHVHKTKPDIFRLACYCVPERATEEAEAITSELKSIARDTSPVACVVRSFEPEYEFSWSPTHKLLCSVKSLRNAVGPLPQGIHRSSEWLFPPAFALLKRSIVVEAPEERVLLLLNVWESFIHHHVLFLDAALHERGDDAPILPDQLNPVTAGGLVTVLRKLVENNDLPVSWRDAWKTKAVSFDSPKFVSTCQERLDVSPNLRGNPVSALALSDALVAVRNQLAHGALTKSGAEAIQIQLFQAVACLLAQVGSVCNVVCQADASNAQLICENKRFREVPVTPLLAGRTGSNFALLTSERIDRLEYVNYNEGNILQPSRIVVRK